MTENRETIIDEDAGPVSSCRQGDLDAFESIVRKYERRMLNIAFRITGNYEDACEATQDAFLSAYRNIRSFRGNARFSTWLTAIVVNLSRNRLKQAKSRRAHEPVSIDDPAAVDDGVMAIDPPSTAPSALDGLEKKDLQKSVRDCIAALEPEFREVIVLRDMQDLSYEEIGAVLKVREGTVKSRLFRAREAVKECLKKVMGTL